MGDMELQHVNVKLFVKDAEKVDLAAVVPVFHRWIQNQAQDELLLDVADYRHVSAGPGVVLIGHDGNYSLDNTGGRLGVRYNRKTVLEGTNQDRLVQATEAALLASRRLETEPSLNGRVMFDGQEIEVFINDRLLAPNTPGTRTLADPEFRSFFLALLGSNEYVVSYPPDPRSLFSVHVRTHQTFETLALLGNLNCLAPVSSQI
jgi:hypothetical protein